MACCIQDVHITCITADLLRSNTVMVTKLTRMTQNIAKIWHLVAESCTT